MKKIHLNVANLDATEMLSREQLKTILGGSSGSNTNTCTKPWHTACDGKKIADACSFVDNGVTKSGYCSQNAFNPCKYCFQGRPHY